MAGMLFISNTGEQVSMGHFKEIETEFPNIFVHHVGSYKGRINVGKGRNNIQSMKYI